MVCPLTNLWKSQETNSIKNFQDVFSSPPKTIPWAPMICLSMFSIVGCLIPYRSSHGFLMLQNEFDYDGFWRWWQNEVMKTRAFACCPCFLARCHLMQTPIPWLGYPPSPIWRGATRAVRPIGHHSSWFDVGGCRTPHVNLIVCFFFGQCIKWCVEDMAG